MGLIYCGDVILPSLTHPRAINGFFGTRIEWSFFPSMSFLHSSYTTPTPLIPSSLALPSAAIVTGVMKGCRWTSVREWNNLSDSPAERTRLTASFFFPLLPVFLSRPLPVMGLVIFCLALTREQEDQGPMPHPPPFLHQSTAKKARQLTVVEYC